MNKIICGDALQVLKTLSDESIQMSMCSPPYYGLRDYKVENQIGLEKTPLFYLEKLWAVFDEVKRVLKKDGVIFVNLGDSYLGHSVSKKWVQDLENKKLANSVWRSGGRDSQYSAASTQRKKDFPDKCLLMIPERFALGMIERGWILRNRICWFKRNAMPSSVKDRFTCTWEYVYFFSKSRRYYFDLDSVRQPLKQVSIDRMNYPLLAYGSGENKANFGKKSQENNPKKVLLKDKGLIEVKNLHGECDEQGRRIQVGLRTKIPQEQSEAFGSPRARNYRNKTADQSYKIGGMRACPEPNDPKYKWHPEKYGEDDPQGARRGRIVPNGKVSLHPLGKNPGDYWDITTRGFKGAHFAVYPEKLCEMPIKAGSKPGDIILDPFSGAGTTLVVAKKLGRQYLGIELNPDYIKLAERRLLNTTPDLFSMERSK